MNLLQRLPTWMTSLHLHAAGTMKIVKVAEKTFIGKDIIHVGIFQKNDERTTYNMIYADGKTGMSYAKRFNVTGVTREKGI